MVIRHHVREHKREDYHVNDYERGSGRRTGSFGHKYEGLRGGRSTKLSYRERQMLPREAFACPEVRAYPVPTAKELEELGYSKKEAHRSGVRHAVDALSRVAHNGTPKQKEEVCKTVKSRYPEVHTKHCDLDPIVVASKSYYDEGLAQQQAAGLRADDWKVTVRDEQSPHEKKLEQELRHDVYPTEGSDAEVYHGQVY